ncbi:MULTISPECIES: DUF2306 domain-containing protein [Roseomonadaceae]|uniref:DUF2306 domain-containing protein n=1 Tax=Falsiroseomonas oleicola TaxID=2801474 RepID=A0ABS6H2V1_9PROT|nr:DUF2306 domain-containing protein [Roseomonas oleicola]MBU8542992.1 DUF2306 domain-containing protein [Roseomonas oleicola]
MSLAPLLAASATIQLHAFAALAALLLGVVQLLAPKGTMPHRTLGWAWVVLLAVVAVSSFWITSRGHLSWIHLISGWTLVVLPFAVLAARRGRIRSHRSAMISLFFGALIVAGAFTLLPGRIMGAVVFGW